MYSAPLETENTPLADMRPTAQATRRIAVDALLLPNNLQTIRTSGLPVCADLEHSMTICEQTCDNSQTLKNDL